MAQERPLDRGDCPKMRQTLSLRKRISRQQVIAANEYLEDEINDRHLDIGFVANPKRFCTIQIVPKPLKSLESGSLWHDVENSGNSGNLFRKSNLKGLENQCEERRIESLTRGPNEDQNSAVSLSFNTFGWSFRDSVIDMDPRVSMNNSQEVTVETKSDIVPSSLEQWQQFFNHQPFKYRNNDDCLEKFLYAHLFEETRHALGESSPGYRSVLMVRAFWDDVRTKLRSKYDEEDEFGEEASQLQTPCLKA